MVCFVYVDRQRRCLCWRLKAGGGGGGVLNGNLLWCCWWCFFWGRSLYQHRRCSPTPSPPKSPQPPPLPRRRGAYTRGWGWRRVWWLLAEWFAVSVHTKHALPKSVWLCRLWTDWTRLPPPPRVAVCLRALPKRIGQTPAHQAAAPLPCRLLASRSTGRLSRRPLSDACSPLLVVLR
jgi:hypothetical protein